MQNSISSSLTKRLNGNLFLRLFFAVYCPPVAVCDKGCFIFSLVFFLYFIQVTCICVAFVFIFSTIGTTLVAGSTSAFCFDVIFEQLFSAIPETCPNSAALFFKLFFAVLVCAIYTIVVLSVFDFLIWFFSCLFHIPAVLIAVLVCLFTDNDRNALVPDCSNAPRKVRFSWAHVREGLILLNRALLCYFFPPLAVSDMGLKKMILVGLLTLCGWYPGVIMVSFLILRNNSTQNKPRSVSHEC